MAPKRRHSQALSGPGPAGYEPCWNCRFNRPLWGYCPACDDLGFVKIRGGAFDPYLPKDYGPILAVVAQGSATSREPGPLLASNERGPVPLPAEIADRARRHRADDLPDAEEGFVHLTVVEWIVHVHLLVEVYVQQLLELIRRAPDSLDILGRDHESLCWAARRMPPLPDFIIDIA